MAYYFTFVIDEDSRSPQMAGATSPVGMQMSDSQENSSSSDDEDSVKSRVRGGVSLDFSHQNLSELPSSLTSAALEPLSVTSLQLEYNELSILSRQLPDRLTNLAYLDLSNNNLCSLPANFSCLRNLHTLMLKHNSLDEDSLPKDFGVGMAALRVLNMSGNKFSDFPEQVCDMSQLKALYLGSNKLGSLPPSIANMTRLEILYLGGNHLTHIPPSIGNLSHLSALILCDNRLHSLPGDIFPRLRSLRSLSLHNNRLSTLPPAIVHLNLVELTLRGNPLVVRFVRDLTYNVPTLRELAARQVKVKRIPYAPGEIPTILIRYLDGAKSCVNPKCKGVYFSSGGVENVNFVDFCGKYRVPLLEYLCSPQCSDTQAAYNITSSSSSGESGESDTDDDTTAAAWDDVPVSKMKRVLLG